MATEYRDRRTTEYLREMMDRMEPNYSYLGFGPARSNDRSFMDQYASLRSITLLYALVLTLGSYAQSTCAQRYDDAKRLYDGGYREECITAITLALDSCMQDREQAGRLLFLKALAEAGEDSLATMHGDLEQLFRTDRGYVIRAYDPLMKGKAGEADLYGGWEILQGNLRKDHGRLRAGIQIGIRNPLISVEGDRKVFETDDAYRYGTEVGYDAGVLLEHDVAHNLAIRASGSYSVQGWTARNNAIRYDETLTSVPLFLGLKKMFWLGERSTWVPYFILGATYAPIIQAKANIERSGDGVRFLAPKTLDRTAERETSQLMGSGVVGVSYKVGHTVLFAEAQYDHAFTPLMLDDPKYSETELLIRYYYVDNVVTLSSVVCRVGVQYVVKYHRKNRINP